AIFCATDCTSGTSVSRNASIFICNWDIARFTGIDPGINTCAVTSVVGCSGWHWKSSPRMNYRRFLFDEAPSWLSRIFNDVLTDPENPATYLPWAMALDQIERPDSLGEEGL